MIWEKRYVGMGTVVAETIPVCMILRPDPGGSVEEYGTVNARDEREAVTAHRRAHPKGTLESFKSGCASLTTCYIISCQCFEPFGCLT